MSEIVHWTDSLTVDDLQKCIAKESYYFNLTLEHMQKHPELTGPILDFCKAQLTHCWITVDEAMQAIVDRKTQ